MKEIQDGTKIFFLIFLIFIFETETECEGGGAETEGDTESEAGSRPWALSTDPITGLEPTNGELMTWAEVGRLTEPPRCSKIAQR